MSAIRQLLTVAVLAVAFALLGVGCGNACEELAKEVCRCEPTEVRQAACVRRVESEASRREATEREVRTCEALLDSCTCDALAQGDLAACGLAN